MGQLQIAKITEATREVETLYSLRSLIMPEHGSKYYAMELPEMIEQSYTKMLKWVNRWKSGIYHSMKSQKTIATSDNLPIWKIWNPDKIKEPNKIVDRKRSEIKTKNKR